MPPVDVRRATARDLDTAAPLFDAYRQFYEQPPDPALARRFLTERLDAGDTVLLLALDADGAGLGFTHLFPSFTSVGAARLFVLNDLFVAPAARRLGVAGALLDAAEAHARSEGAVRLVLQTAVDNGPAQRLYERRGWTRDDAFVTYELAV
ncbi:MAG TPA: GNAT family N-acetyltransferase [Rubricoccaceae bacterium]|jgi:GNAT superfamily N-acetyltransferase